MSKKKKKRKAKVATLFVVPEHKPKPQKSIDKLAWDMARIMTKMRPDPKLVNKKVYCKKCDQYYCLGFDGVDVYCKGCFYYPCQKELTGERLCHQCE